MTHARKMMAGLALGLAIAVPSALQAATVDTSVVTAGVTVGGGSAAMSVNVRNLSNNAIAPSVAWTASAGDPWKLANQYVQINSTLSVAGAGIQTYTNNTLGSANPPYSGAVSSGAAAGLVNTVDRTKVIPMAWQVRPQGQAPEAIDDPDHVAGTGWAWFYFADKAGGLMPNAPANSYVHVLKEGNLFHYGHLATEFGSGGPVNNLYLEANFAAALGGQTYQTSTLTVELFTL